MPIDEHTMAQHLLPEDLLAHDDWMRSLARRLLSDEGRAHDVVQEAFTAVAERRPPRPRSMGAWLRGMVRNLARHAGREDRRRRRREELAARPESCRPTYAERLERAEIERAIADCVLALPEPYRGVILDRYFNDMPAADIAARDRVPLATVRTRIQRGLDRLRLALDARHGGDGVLWGVMLAPLASAGPVSIARGASAAGGGLQGTAAGATAPATGSIYIIGGTLMIQKTIAATVAAGLLSLALGFGLGRSTAPPTPGEIGQQKGLADARTIEGLEARIAETGRLARQDAEKARNEIGALTSRIVELDAQLEAARAQAALLAAPRDAGALPIAFGDFADMPELLHADWKGVAGALREMNALLLERLEKLEKGEPIDDELMARLAAETAKVSKFALDVMGTIPTNAAFNGEWTHPIVLSNILGAMLEESGMPITAGQSAEIGKLGNQYERQYAEKQQGYSDDMPVLRKMLDEIELKHEFSRSLRAQLSSEQREEVFVPKLQDRLEDALSPAASVFFLVQPKSYPSPGAAREEFRRSTLEAFDLGPSQVAALEPAFDAWFEDVKSLLSPQPPSRLQPALDDVLQAGRAQEALITRILEVPGLDSKIRKALLDQRQWTLPQVFEKEP